PYTLSFIAASVLSARLARRARRFGEPGLVVRTYACFSVFCFLVAMEHISWGQAIVEYPTPFGIGRVNEQHQFNLHNLPGLNELHSSFPLVTGVAGLIGTRLGTNPRLRHVEVPPILTPVLWAITLMAALQIVNDLVLVSRLFNFIVFVLRYVIEFVIGLCCF